MFESLNADGHAGFAEKGRDIVCAAVSALLNTTGTMIDGIDGVNLIQKTPSRGNLSFQVEVTKASLETQISLKNAADFLKIALKNISEEYPKNLNFRVQP